ncbi:hypothetical protein F4779DRAFT_605343 [Xylariaceae sp. FL0662B]|nr:hypothetical protein F4779DRAFT_605343 [Xylariaceae sp. FL0662B]
MVLDPRSETTRGVEHDKAVETRIYPRLTQAVINCQSILSIARPFFFFFFLKARIIESSFHTYNLHILVVGMTILASALFPRSVVRCRGACDNIHTPLETPSTH